MTAHPNGVAVYFKDPQSYGPLAILQDMLQSARAEGRIPDTVLFLEHHPVITLGRRGRERYLKRSRQDLAAEGCEVFQSSRGGDVTYHGPGQLVVYPILQWGKLRTGAHGFLERLEEIALRTAGSFGVDAFRRPGMNGAWTARGKLAAIGFCFKRWVTSHGMSFNVDVDLGGFEAIVPCGLEGEKVTSLKSLLGADCPSMAEVRECMRRHASSLLDLALPVFDAARPPPPGLDTLFRAWRESLALTGIS